MEMDPTSSFDAVYLMYSVMVTFIGWSLYKFGQYTMRQVTTAKAMGLIKEHVRHGASRRTPGSGDQRERRYKRVYLNEHQMMFWFKDGVFQVTRGVPHDAEIVRISYDPSVDGLGIMFYHPSWPVVEDCHIIPAVETEVSMEYIGEGKKKQMREDGKLKTDSKIGSIATAIITAAATSLAWALVQMAI